MTKSELQEIELSELLAQTSEMTADAAKKQYEEFVVDTKHRVQGVINRLQHRYNIGKKINSINKQSLLTTKTFQSEMRKRNPSMDRASSQVSIEKADDKKTSKTHVLADMKEFLENTV